MRKEKSHEHDFDPLRSDHLPVWRLCGADPACAGSWGAATKPTGSHDFGITTLIAQLREGDNYHEN